ncbi:integrase, catalytic region [Citreicella sp. SE45]|nr:integrase, catalytic region [Citreicella sp. SE45]
MQANAEKDDQREAHGVEPICRVLPIAPSTYYDHLARRADPARLSDRARRDAVLRPEIERVFEENWRVYGVRKVWRQLDREGFAVARCTVARLMKGMGIQGIIRGKPHKTTIPDKKAPVPAGQGEPAIPRARAERALGQRVHLRRHLEGLRLVRAVPSDRWRAGPHLLSSTPTHAGSSVGGRARPRTQALCSMPSNRLTMIAARSRARGSSTIPTAGRNTCPFATPGG